MVCKMARNINTIAGVFLIIKDSAISMWMREETVVPPASRRPCEKSCEKSFTSAGCYHAGTLLIRLY